jgi:hypothetical protein
MIKASIKSIIHALESRAASTDHSHYWLAAMELRKVTQWQTSVLEITEQEPQQAEPVARELQAWRDHGKHYGLQAGIVAGTWSVFEVDATGKSPDPT